MIVYRRILGIRMDLGTRMQKLKIMLYYKGYFILSVVLGSTDKWNIKLELSLELRPSRLILCRLISFYNAYHTSNLGLRQK